MQYIVFQAHMNNRNKSMASPVLGGAAILVALYTVLFGGVQNFTTEDAEHLLEDLSSHLSEESSYRGKETKLQYNNLEIKGFAYEKFAHVSKLSLDFIYQQWQGGTRLGISTENAELIPDPSNGSRTFLRLGDGVNLISSSELLAIIKPAKPLLYSFNKHPKEEGAVKHRLQVPGNIGVTMLNPKREVTLQLSKPAHADITFFEDRHRLRTQIVSGPLVALMDSGYWRIDDADIRYDSVQRSADVAESKGTLTLENIGFNRKEVNPDPYNLTAAWTLREQKNIGGATDSSQLDIEHCLLTDDNVKIAVNGVVNFDIDDKAYGELTVEISNPSLFLKSAWISPNKRELATSLLHEVLGDDADIEKQIIITLSRPKDGQWRIGKMPLDALLDKGFLSLFPFLDTQETHDKNNDQKTTGKASAS
jgi:hypothetical protein